MDHSEYKGDVYHISFSPIGRDRRTYVYRRKYPCMDFIVSDREGDRERAAATIYHEDKDYHLLVGNLYDKDAPEEKMKKVFKGAGQWYLRYLWDRDAKRRRQK